MDSDLKHAIAKKISDWNDKTVEEAVSIMGKIVTQVSNPAVYRKEFDSMIQCADETIYEFVTRLRGCAIDCSCTCPYDEGQDLTDYHLFNRLKECCIW